MAISDFLDWATIGTYAGCAAVTTLIVQIIKHVGFMAKIPTEIVSWVIATLLLVGSHVVLDPATFTLGTAALCVLNGAIVSFTSNKVFEGIKRIAAQNTPS